MDIKLKMNIFITTNKWTFIYRNSITI